MDDDDPSFGKGVAVDHGHAVGLEIHPLRHVETGEWISGGGVEGKVQMESIAVGGASSDANDAGSCRGEVVLVHAPDNPRAMRLLAVFKKQILLKVQPVSFDVSVGRGGERGGRLAGAGFKDAPGVGATGEEFVWSKNRAATIKGSDRLTGASADENSEREEK